MSNADGHDCTGATGCTPGKCQFEPAPQPAPDPRCRFVWEGNVDFPGVCGVLKGLHHMQTHRHEFTEHSAYRTEAHCGTSVVANSSVGLNVSLAAHSKRCGKCKGRYAPQAAPSGDEAKVRETANAADIGVIVTRLGGSNRQLDEVYDLLDKLQKQAYAAGKADGRREAEDGYLIDIRQARWGHGDNDAIDDELVRLHNLIIARRGSEGK